MHRPQVLFLDEPTTGLDPEARTAMWEEISRLAGEEGLTILLTTHYLEEADRLAERIAIVDRGRVVAEGTPDELKGELRGDAVHVELRDTPDEVDARLLATALGEFAAVREVTVEGRRLSARADDGPAAVPHVLAVLEQQGAAVASVTVARPSLDDVYLRYAGRRFADADTGTGGTGATAVQPHGERGRRPMSTETLHQTWYMTQRQLMAILRQPVFLVVTLVQPVIWLFLFGSLFRKVVELPGFGAGSYLDYLVPGVVVMSAVSSNMWAYMGTLEEIERGTLNRFLTTPVSRTALMNANVLQQGCSTAAQSVLIVLLGKLGGADYPGGIGGLLVLLLASVLLGTVFGAASNAVGMLVRQRESIIGINSFLLLPLTFLSSAFMAPGLMPSWMRHVADGNPVNWALVAGRSAMSADPDWGDVLSRGGALLALAVAAVWLSTRTFRSYQQSV